MNEQLRKKIRELPSKPGIYRYLDAQGKIIYIGKAKSLKKRVSSYFSKTHADKTALLVRDIVDLDFVVTDNEVEALILEASLIRQHKPLYNIDLKDGVRYAYLKITNEPFPRLLTVRKVDKDKAKYFGPYTDGTSRENSARLLRSTFKIRTCGSKLPKKACLQFYIGNCDAPCINNISGEDYQKNVDAVANVLKGKTKLVIRQLDQEMATYAKRKQYELARSRRDQIRSLNQFSQRQKIAMYRSYNEDVLHYIHAGKQTYIQLFRVEKGQVGGKQEFLFDTTPEVVESFIRQYYSTNEIPDALLVPSRLADHELIEAYLTKLKGKKVSVMVPKVGQKKKLLDMVYRNVLYATEQEDQALIHIRDALNLTGVPNVIECFDISTILGEYTVASMVQFRGGVPDKDHYRRFRIKTVSGQDDFAAMAEVVRRRYTRLIEEKRELPNLIIIDGGRGQLNAAWNVLQDLQLHIPIIGLAKREEEIYRIEALETLRLPKDNKGLQLLQRIRDEAHRFAITYHRLLRGKGMLKK